MQQFPLSHGTKADKELPSQLLLLKPTQCLPLVNLSCSSDSVSCRPLRHRAGSWQMKIIFSAQRAARKSFFCRRSAFDFYFSVFFFSPKLLGT